MRILQVHNSYIYPGGEDSVVRNEADLLIKNGHKVLLLARDNHSIYQANIIKRIKIFFAVSWNKGIADDFESLIDSEMPDICHVHNIFPLISPYVLFLCYIKNIPVVMSVHNYRLICPKATLFKNGEICELCVGGNFIHGFIHRCYQGSLIKTYAVIKMLKKQIFAGSWFQLIDGFIFPTHFSASRFKQLGISQEKITIKPHYAGNNQFWHMESNKKYFSYIGRVTEDKGIVILCQAFKIVNAPLMVAGDGPLINLLKEEYKNISFLGHLGQQSIERHLGYSIALIYPTLLYETFGIGVIEAFAAGTPVIASRHGALEELIIEGETGFLFSPGNAEELASKVKWAWDHPEEMAEMGRAARREYEKRFTPERNYEMLMEIYQKAIKHHQKRRIPKH